MFLKRVRIPPGILSFVLLALATACGHDTGKGGTPGASPSTANSADTVTALPDTAYRLEWGTVTAPPSMLTGEKALVSVTVKNTSPNVWPDPKMAGGTPPGTGAVRLSYRWWSPGSPIASTYETRVDLRAPVGPGESATMAILVTAPPKSGAYKLQFDLVQELVSWFEEKGAPTKIIPVQVK